MYLLPRPTSRYAADQGCNRANPPVLTSGLFPTPAEPASTATDEGPYRTVLWLESTPKGPTFPNPALAKVRLWRHQDKVRLWRHQDE